MSDWQTKATVVEDDEGCTVVYPPLSWPKGARIILSWDGAMDDDRYTLTPAGRDALKERK